jgi:hypothetical protein
VENGKTVKPTRRQVHPSEQIHLMPNWSPEQPLPNLRQETFCQLCVTQGYDTYKAYREAYSIGGEGALHTEQLKQVVYSDAVQQRLKYLREALAEDWNVTRKYIIQRLKLNVERSLQMVPVYDSTGEKVGTFVYNGHVANQALKLLGQSIGMFTSEGFGGGNGDLPIPDQGARVTFYIPDNQRDRKLLTAGGDKGPVEVYDRHR